MLYSDYYVYGYMNDLWEPYLFFAKKAFGKLVYDKNKLAERF